MLFLSACSDESDIDFKLAEAVRSYYFLDDTAFVEAEITDTLLLDRVNELIENVESNLTLVENDLESLNDRIDSLGYSLLIQREQDSGQKNIDYTIQDKLLLETKYQKEKLRAQQVEYYNTGRMLKHLKRTATDQIAGYGIRLVCFSEGHQIRTEMILNSRFEIAD